MFLMRSCSHSAIASSSSRSAHIHRLRSAARPPPYTSLASTRRRRCPSRPVVFSDRLLRQHRTDCLGATVYRRPINRSGRSYACPTTMRRRRHEKQGRSPRGHKERPAYALRFLLAHSGRDPPALAKRPFAARAPANADACAQRDPSPAPPAAAAAGAWSGGVAPTSMAVPPSQGSWPVIISYRTTPSRKGRPPVQLRPPATCSGAITPAVSSQAVRCRWLSPTAAPLSPASKSVAPRGGPLPLERPASRCRS